MKHPRWIFNIDLIASAYNLMRRNPTKTLLKPTSRFFSTFLHVECVYVFLSLSFTVRLFLLAYLSLFAPFAFSSLLDLLGLLAPLALLTLLLLALLPYLNAHFPVFHLN
jgi:hypothetical protein